MSAIVSSRFSGMSSQSDACAMARTNRTTVERLASIQRRSPQPQLNGQFGM